MKRILFAVAICLAFVACNKETVQVDPLEVYNVTSEALPAPAGAEQAMLVKITDNLPAELSALQNIEITEAGYFIAYKNGQRKLVTKGDDATNVVAGTWKTENGYIVISVLGVEVKIPAGAASAIKNVLIGGKNYGATGTEYTGTPANTSTSLCRTWHPTKYHATLKSGQNVVYNKENTTLISLQKDLFDYILKDVSDEEVELFEGELESIIFTKLNTASLVMTGITEVCEWQWADENEGTIKFSVGQYDVTAKLLFSAGTPNTMYVMIDLDVAFQKYSKLAEYNLNGKFVITMVDAK